MFFADQSVIGAIGQMLKFWPVGILFYILWGLPYGIVAYLLAMKKYGDRKTAIRCALVAALVPMAITALIWGLIEVVQKWASVGKEGDGKNENE